LLKSARLFTNGGALAMLTQELIRKILCSLEVRNAIINGVYFDKDVEGDPEDAILLAKFVNENPYPGIWCNVRPCVPGDAKANDSALYPTGHYVSPKIDPKLPIYEINFSLIADFQGQAQRGRLHRAFTAIREALVNQPVIDPSATSQQSASLREIDVILTLLR
jgi:hypothetical protein